MKSVMAEGLSDPVTADGAPLDLERECELWDWVRTAGISAADLRKALRDLLGNRNRDQN